jgi:TatD DNase family protein
LTSSTYIDFHTHKPIHLGQDHILEVISSHIVNKYPEQFYTMGHHPWWSDEELTSEELKTLALHISNEKFLAIGECGLDKLKGASKEIQEKVFLQQVLVANQLGVPLIMHCVRQNDRAIAMKKEYGITPWVIHGYKRNKILAKDLLDAGIMLSISPSQKMSANFIEMIEYLPLDTFFIETDSEYSLSIIERYDLVAELKKIDTFALQKYQIDNFNQFFKWKQTSLIG